MSRPATYGSRNATLRNLGFANYAAYLRSELWSSIRSRVLVAEPQCRLCHAPAANVHHIGYGRATLLGEKLTALVPLCGYCHRRVEFTSKGEKRTLQDSEMTFRKLWRICPHRKRRKQPRFLRKAKGAESAQRPAHNKPLDLDAELDRRLRRDG